MYKTTNGVFPTVSDSAILGFFGEYRYLSNFHPSPLEVGGLVYGNSEAAYMAQKSFDPMVKQRFTTLTGVEAKKLGRKIELRPDWDEYRLEAMLIVLRAKFGQSVELAELLLSTGNKYLEETNYWKDTFWGVCEGNGTNWLGKTLMMVRSELRDGSLMVKNLS